MNIGVAVKAFIESQDAAFREQALLWARDELITNEEFGRLVADLGFRQALDRIAFNAYLGVDESQRSDVE